MAKIIKWQDGPTEDTSVVTLDNGMTYTTKDNDIDKCENIWSPNLSDDDLEDEDEDDFDLRSVGISDGKLQFTMDGIMVSEDVMMIACAEENACSEVVEIIDTLKSFMLGAEVTVDEATNTLVTTYMGCSESDVIVG